MPREAPEVRLLRETLEGVLHPSKASTLLFEALEERGGAPATTDEVRALVEGPLSRRLAECIGAETAASVLSQLVRMLDAIAPAGRAERSRRHDEPTRNLMLSDETLPVFVLSGSRTFADQLQATLGPQVMSAVFVPNGEVLRTRLDQVHPAIVLIDASDFPAIEPTELVDQLATLANPQVVKAIWGADLPYGQSVLDAGQRRRVALTPFDRAEGAEPLMDVIRSRRASY